MSEARTFVDGLLSRGMELLIRNNRLWIWPVDAYKFLTDDEHQFLRDHRRELKELVRSGLPETQVIWCPPTTDTAPEQKSSTPPPIAGCAFCCGPCVGDAHHAYSTLHFCDPKQIAERQRRAAAVMLARLTKRRQPC